MTGGPAPQAVIAACSPDQAVHGGPKPAGPPHLG